jgi:hypothetical protein
MAHFEECEDAGIYNCRNARGTSTPSIHSDGRAWDAHFDQPGRGLRNPKGDLLANWCVENHVRFNIQCVIWNRRIWSSTRNYWRTYSGVNPHLDHVHIEQNWDGALSAMAIDAACQAAFSGQPQEEDEVKPYLIHVAPHFYLVQADALIYIKEKATVDELGRLFGNPVKVDATTFERMKVALNSDAAGAA